jgi:hypothetical protein
MYILYILMTDKNIIEFDDDDIDTNNIIDTNIVKNNIIKKNIVKHNKIVLNTTSGVDVNEDYYINDNHNYNQLALNTISEVDENEENDDNNINNWDNKSEFTVNNWYKMLKQQSFIYQKILDYNLFIANIILIIILILSSSLGILTTFKIYSKSSEFELASDIVLITSHTLIVILISISKMYNDETTNEKYRNHISELDQLKSELSSQLLLTREDRQEKTEFFIKYSNYYTRLITKSPNLSIKQIDYAKSIYLEYLEHFSG